ncbi:hypothetical protein JOJ86_005919 [Rhodococcus percolatus]|uniref:hypothetical protein n=1 Tax=Rhodococcus opacus TaxID=37919 RepID=UPI001AEB44AE|nr:hypothetical protein [Rhodococcus opacus]MBP2208193.1 hypothetical protein [Rhodococcus opacus]
MSNAKRMFAAYVENHEMTVVKDDGLYRHLRFKSPGSSIFWFDIVTWPSNLVITGDVEPYHFAREEDMFEFFAESASEFGINPGYWGQKIRGNNPHVTYSEDEFKKQVVEYFMENRHDVTDALGLWKTIREDVLACAYDENEARHQLNNFHWRDTDGSRFEFGDSWEWDLTDYDHHYLMSLHAIVWGIQRYRAGVKC